MALVVLVVEGYFVYRWYDRYYDYDAAASGVASSAADPKTVEGSGLETAQDTENADSGENSGETTFPHTAMDENSRGDYTYLTHLTHGLEIVASLATLEKLPGQL
jgi:hypothetical protein